MPLAAQMRALPLEPPTSVPLSARVLCVWMWCSVVSLWLVGGPVPVASEVQRFMPTGEATLTTDCADSCNGTAPCIHFDLHDTPSNATGNGMASASEMASGSTGGSVAITNATVCLDAPSNSSKWAFSPSLHSTKFEFFDQIGRLQLPSSVEEIEINGREMHAHGSTFALGVAPFAIEHPSVLKRVVIRDASVEELDRAAPLNKVQELAMPNCSISSFPAALVSGDQLRSVDLSANSIGNLSRMIVGSPLATLDLASNRLESFEPDPTSEFLQTVETLNLSSNQLSGFPSIIFSMPRLVTLDLSSNSLTSARFSSSQSRFLGSLQSFSFDLVKADTCEDERSDNTGSNEQDVVCFLRPERMASPMSTPPASSSTKSSSVWSPLRVPLYVALGAVVLVAVIVGVIQWRKRAQYQKRCRQLDKSLDQSLYSPMPSFSATTKISSDCELMRATSENRTTREESDPCHLEPQQNPSVSSCPQNLGANALASPVQFLSALEESSLANWRLNDNDVFLVKNLQREQHHEQDLVEIWLGEYLEKPVVIKKIARATHAKCLAAFQQEIRDMTQLRHPGLAVFYGTMWNRAITELSAVVEHLNQPNLREFLGHNVRQLTCVAKRDVALQIAYMLRFLHSNDFTFQGNLDSFHVFVDAMRRVKADLLAVTHHIKDYLQLEAEKLVFVAPELFLGERRTPASDVYSLGVVLVELDVEQSPWQNCRRSCTAVQTLSVGSTHFVFGGGSHTAPSFFACNDDADLATSSKSTSRFEFNPSCSPEMADIVADCLVEEPTKRPTLQEVIDALESLQTIS